MELASLIRHTLLVSSFGILAACSSADSTSTTPNTPAAPTAVTLSGSVFASDVSGATVTIKKTDGTTVAGPVTTSSDGSYSIDILDTELASDLVFESTGGGFVDEETGLNATAGSMAAYVTGGTLADGDSVHVTPGTTIHANLITDHGKNPAEAQAAFFHAFAYNPDISVDPVDITDPSSSNADDASRHAGWVAAVLSRLSNNLIPNQPDQQFDMFAAIAQDLTHIPVATEPMDGKDASGPVLIGTTATNSPTTDDYITVTDSFNTSNVANLRITYTPPPTMLNPHGKNVFTVKVEDTSGGGTSPVDGLLPDNLKVMPMMYMADRNHATPMGGITALGGGEYEVTAYYLMPSRMMDGTTMGTWDLKIMANMQSVHIYPNIDMAMMNNTVRVQLKGVDDKIVNMDGLPVPRNYNIFKDRLEQQGAGSTYDFDVFIAPMENMMSFPALVDGMTLTSGLGGTPYDINGIAVEASDDGGSTWKTGTTGVTDGVWSFSSSNSLNLNAGVANEVLVRLTVSGEVKTTDGLPVATDPGAANYPNDFATFTLTP